MTHEQLSAFEQQTIVTITNEVLARTVKEIITAYPPEAIRVAAAVGSSLPPLGVEGGELVRREGLDEQIRQQLERVNARRLED